MAPFFLRYTTVIHIFKTHVCGTRMLYALYIPTLFRNERVTLLNFIPGSHVLRVCSKLQWHGVRPTICPVGLGQLALSSACPSSGRARRNHGCFIEVAPQPSRGGRHLPNHSVELISLRPSVEGSGTESSNVLNGVDGSL